MLDRISNVNLNAPKWKYEEKNKTKNNEKQTEKEGKFHWTNGKVVSL